MARQIVVPDEALPYLVLQKGRLDPLKHDPAKWLPAYRACLADQFDEIEGFLPRNCAKMLDVGSGLGGIDILIARKTGAEVYLLDGEADEPVMRVHRETFNDMAVAGRFFEANGEKLAGYYTPKSEDLGGPYDLVVSFGSWCFHYPPAVYLDRVLKACKPGAVLIVDVRHGHTLPGAVIHEARYPKFSRMVVRV